MGNKWTDHVKAEARRLGLSYGCALTDERVKNSYRQKSPPKAKRPKGRPKKKVVSKSPSKSKSSSISKSPSVSKSPSRRLSLSPKKKPSSTKKALKQLIADSPYKTPELIKRQRAGVKGRKTGQVIKRQVRRDADSLENVDDFFDQFSSSLSE